MGNVQTTIGKIEFIIKDELTHCNLFYSSTEPDNPAWGGGWKTKTFPKSKTVIDILKDDVANYLEWSNGREG